MGVETGLTQIVAEELDVPFEPRRFCYGRYCHTPIRAASAAARPSCMARSPCVTPPPRRALCCCAGLAAIWALRPTSSRCTNGVVSVKGDPSRKISYADLAGRRRSGRGPESFWRRFRAECARALANPKTPRTYTVVGQSDSSRRSCGPRFSANGNTLPTCAFPECCMAASFAPPASAPSSISVDDSAAKKIPGYVQTVTKAISSASSRKTNGPPFAPRKRRKVNWTAPRAAFPEQKDLYQHMRSVDSQGHQGNPQARRCRRRARSRGRRKCRPATKCPFNRTPPWARVRRRRCSYRWRDHDLVRRPKTSRAAKRLCRIAARSARQSPRHLGRRRRLLRPSRLSKTPQPTPCCYLKPSANPCACSGLAPI